MQFKRSEIKYYINNLQMEGLISTLSGFMNIDQYSDHLQGYKIRSLYFDSFDDECLYQKQSGFLVRKKIRLRTYGDPNAEVAKLEIKKKFDQRIQKDSLTIDRATAIKMTKGDYSSILKLNHPVADEVYATFTSRIYKPKVIVEYQRLAFVFPVSNVRITFDKNLSSNINHTELFSTSSNLMPVILEGKQIMEVKFDQFLPATIKQILSGIASERSAISKYTLARRFHKINKWEDN